MTQSFLRLFVFVIVSISLLFIISPIVNIFIDITSKSILSTIQDISVWNSIFTSISCAFFSTIIGLILGIPLGYFIKKTKFKGISILEGIINIPVAIPHVAVGIALLSLFNDRTYIGRFFMFFDISFVDTVYGITLCMLFVSISFIISSSIVGFKSVSEELEMVARSHGASSIYTFIHIVLPLAFPSIFRGAILAFARSVSEVGAILIMAYYPKTAPILMYEKFEQYGLSASKPVCALVILVCLVVFFSLLYVSKKYVRS